MSGVDVYITDEVGPAVIGLLRPRIAVPRWVTMSEPSQQAAIIAHEQSHLDARDPQLFSFALALLVLMPWNLPLWWQLHRLRYAIEVDCDGRVLKGGMDPAHYGETLVVVGERQSAYIGAVAAMSESQSFLEERIRIMISKPVKWRRVGIAALAGSSLALTVLAAQVSPPNAAGNDAAPGTEPAAQPAKKTAERVAIKLSANVLDRYVGSYELDDNLYVDIKREGESLMARLTGQPAFEIFPESEQKFFWKVTDAQITFTTDGSGLAPSATLHQHGLDMPLVRVDASASAAAQQMLDARVQSQTPSPDSEAALRRTIQAAEQGRINYEDMEPMLADATRKQEEGIKASLKQLGAMKSITFSGVGDQGWDSYEVKFANGTLNYRISMASNGKIAGMMALPLP